MPQGGRALSRPPLFLPDWRAMTLEDRIAAISERRRFGMKPGLERMEALLEALGGPERGLACVHVAGTNGKGSVAAMVASVLQRAGLGDVGLYTSPHLVFFNERIRIGGAPISDAALDRALGAVLAADSGEASFFELATATAFVAFRDAGVRLAVVETGLGGRLDATNVIVPVLSVITNIGLEHCQYLGDTIGEIAFEKAGIVKPGRPVVAGAMDPVALEVIRKRAAALSAPFFEARTAVSSRKAKDGSERVAIEDDSRAVGNIRLPLGGPFQRENLSTAITALEVFSQAAGMPLEDDAVRAGLESVVWPCRFQRVCDTPAVIVDGAHNPPAAVALARAIANVGAPIALVAGMCDDKNAGDFLRILHPQARVAFATETPNDRTMPAGGLAALMRAAGWRSAQAIPNWRDALDAATAWALENGGAVIVCGSLFLAGAVADLYGALPWRGGARAPNEALREK